MLITAKMLLRYVRSLIIKYIHKKRSRRSDTLFSFGQWPAIRFQFCPSEEQSLGTPALKYTNGDTGMC